MKAEIIESFSELHWSDLSIKHNDINILSIPIHSDVAKVVADNFNTALSDHVKSELKKILEEFTDENIGLHFIASKHHDIAIKIGGWLRDELMKRIEKLDQLNDK